jgi:hypothetical protein
MLGHDRRQVITGTIQIDVSVIRWSRVRAPPTPRQRRWRIFHGWLPAFFFGVEWQEVATSLNA